MKEKKYLIITLSIVLLTLVGTTYAYFSSVIVGDKKNITVDMAELKIIFTNGELLAKIIDLLGKESIRGSTVVYVA